MKVNLEKKLHVLEKSWRIRSGGAVIEEVEEKDVSVTPDSSLRRFSVEE